MISFRNLLRDTQQQKVEASIPIWIWKLALYIVGEFWPGSKDCDMIAYFSIQSGYFKAQW